MIVYIFIFLMIIVFRIIFNKKYFGLKSDIAITNKKEKKIDIFFITSFLLLFFFMGFRGKEVGIDTPNYISWFDDFNRIGWNKVFSLKKDVEPGYLLINYLVSQFSINPHFLILSVSFIILFSHLLFIKTVSKNYYISLILFLSFNHFFTAMSSWRQFIAMGIVFFSYPLLLGKKYFASLLVMTIAFFFHYSTLIFDIALIIAWIFSKNKKWILLFLFISIISAPIVEFLFKKFILVIPKYNYYIIKNASGKIGKLRFIYIILELSIIIYIIKNNAIKSRNINMMCIMLCFSIIIGLAGKSIPLIFRLGYYFEYFLILIIPELMVSYKKNTFGIQTIVTLGGFIFYFYLMMVNSAGMIPWKMY